jgi:hypothetical protein
LPADKSSPTSPLPADKSSLASPSFPVSSSSAVHSTSSSFPVSSSSSGAQLPPLSPSLSPLSPHSKRLTDQLLMMEFELLGALESGSSVKNEPSSSHSRSLQHSGTLYPFLFLLL